MAFFTVVCLFGVMMCTQGFLMISKTVKPLIKLPKSKVFSTKSIVGEGIPDQSISLKKLLLKSDTDSTLPIIIKTDNVPIYIFSSQEIEYAALEQLKNLAKSVIPVGFVSAMPDVHLGKGATVGSVFASEKYIAPNAVGVDIGCGMTAIPFPSLKKGDLTEPIKQDLFKAIKKSIPTGFNCNDVIEPKVRHDLEKICRSYPPTKWLQSQIGGEYSDRVLSQIGTLGGGNHFIEVLHDEDDTIWAMLHSGSRFIGKHTAEYYNVLAKQQMKSSTTNVTIKGGKKIKKTVDSIEIPQTANDSKELVSYSELAYLVADSQEGQDYLTDMLWCQHYAYLNRETMLNRLIKVIQDVIPSSLSTTADISRRINIHHNFCELKETTYPDPNTGEVKKQKLWITRKGATSAALGQYGIIPGSMGVGSYIVRGKGNTMSWQSCSHGAGRLMSRTMAKKFITMNDFNKDMGTIVYDKTPELLDEAPKAYKPLDQVMKDQEMLVEVVHRLLPLINVKGYK